LLAVFSDESGECDPLGFGDGEKQQITAGRHFEHTRYGSW
jgi:hypothetical protein